MLRVPNSHFLWWIESYREAKDGDWIAIPACNSGSTLLNCYFKRTVENWIAAECGGRARVEAYAYIVFDNVDDLALALLKFRPD